MATGVAPAVAVSSCPGVMLSGAPADTENPAWAAGVGGGEDEHEAATIADARTTTADFPDRIVQD
jgi:hypothetical protein